MSTTKTSQNREYLTKEQLDEIYVRIRAAFDDLKYFDRLLAAKVKKVLADTNVVTVDTRTTRKLTEKYFDVETFKSEQEKIILSQIHLVLRCCYTLVLSYYKKGRDLMMPDVPALLAKYPEFIGKDEEELNYLLKFRNYLRVTLEIIPAKLNKQLLLKIAARLEGSGKEYITGGGQKECVTRRVIIYEKEGDISAEKRVDRVRAPRVEGQPRKRGATSTMKMKEVKLMRIASDDLARLAKNPSDPFKNIKSSQSITGRTNSTEPQPISYSTPTFLPLSTQNPTHASTPANYHSYSATTSSLSTKPFLPPSNTMSSSNITFPAQSTLAPLNYPTIPPPPSGSNNNANLYPPSNNLFPPSNNFDGVFNYSTGFANNDIDPDLFNFQAQQYQQQDNFQDVNYDPYYNNNFEYNAVPIPEAVPDINTLVRGSSLPSLYRCTTDILDCFLPPEDDPTSANITDPSLLSQVGIIRSITSDVQNGSFTEDLKLIFDSQQ